MNDLLKMKFFRLLSETSQTVTNAIMQNAYEEFVKQIVTISSSEDSKNVSSYQRRIRAIKPENSES